MIKERKCALMRDKALKSYIPFDIPYLDIMNECFIRFSYSQGIVELRLAVKHCRHLLRKYTCSRKKFRRRSI